MNKRFFASTQFFLAKHSLRGPHAFATKESRPVEFNFNGIRIAAISAGSFNRPSLKKDGMTYIEGATLEFRDFATMDDAYEFCREFMVTLATRAASRGGAISFSTARHEYDSSNENWQIMPGINIRNVLEHEFYSVTAGMETASLYPSTPGEWLHDMMHSAPMLRADELEPAIAAYALAYGTPMLESRLLTLFAVLEGLAGAPKVNEELTARINAFQDKVRKDPNYTAAEHHLLNILDGKKQKSQKFAVEALLKTAEAPDDLLGDLNLAYKARGAFAHSAKSHERLADMTKVVETLVISVLTDRVRRAQRGQV